MFKFWGRKMKVIDGKDMILGRLATQVAKMALNGEEVTIVNCESVIVVGKKKEIFGRYQQRAARGTHSTGPFLHRAPDRIVRRTIRGMLSYKTPNGKAAFQRVMCYVGVPSDVSMDKVETLKGNITETQNLNFVTVGDISKQLGAKL